MKENTTKKNVNIAHQVLYQPVLELDVLSILNVFLGNKLHAL